MSGRRSFEVRVPTAEPRRRVSGTGSGDDGAPRRAVRALLQRVAESAQDSRELAAVVVLQMPPLLRGVPVPEFLGWIRGSNDRLVARYMRAATVVSEPTLGDLNGFQRAALIGALRLRRI